MALGEGVELLADADRLSQHAPRSLAEIQELALEMRDLFGGPPGSTLYLHRFIDRLCEGCETLLNQESVAARQSIAA